MTGTNAAIRSMKSKIGKLDKETLKQQEIMYNQVMKKQVWLSTEMRCVHADDY